MFWSFLHQLSGNNDRLPKSRPWSECWTIEENNSSTVLKVLKTHWTANWKTAEKAKKSLAERLSHNAPQLDAVIPLGQLIQAGKNISNTLLQVGNSWWATTIRPDPTAINTSMSLERPGGFLYLSSETDPALRMVRRRALGQKPLSCSIRHSVSTLELNLIYGYPKMRVL
jgi:hypothetical protein